MTYTVLYSAHIVCLLNSVQSWCMDTISSTSEVNNIKRAATMIGQKYSHKFLSIWIKVYVIKEFDF